jgi:polar amino acid transport system substrate-binding protein
MLFSRRTEVIILDMNIFAFFVKSNVGGRYNQNFTVHYIFDEREYSAAFKTEQHRDMFDEGIALIKEQGVYQLVLDRYLQ